jgi:hypothetical protein
VEAQGDSEGDATKMTVDTVVAEKDAKAPIQSDPSLEDGEGTQLNDGTEV